MTRLVKDGTLLDVQHIMVDAQKGVQYRPGLSEAIRLSLEYHVDVIFVHNGRRVRIDPDAVLDIVEEKMTCQ